MPMAGCPTDMHLSRAIFGGKRHSSNARPFDDMASDFAKASEVSLIALRGYVLAGNPGFREEWRQATGKRKALEAEIERNAYLWTDGERLVQLRNLRMSMDSLAENEKLVASLVGTSNRFPGLRFIMRMCNRRWCGPLNSAMIPSNRFWSGQIKRRNRRAAELRGNIRLAEEGLSTFRIPVFPRPRPNFRNQAPDPKAPAASTELGRRRSRLIVLWICCARPAFD